jgi:branched-chain amino acid aminotransferase
MSNMLAFDSGQFLPANQLSIPIYDTGYMLGVTISEQLRTFGGKLFALDRHLQRLSRSLETIELDPGMSLQAIGDAALSLVENNHKLLDKGDDLGCTILISPGANASLAPSGENRPRVRMHTQPLAFSSWRDVYDEGVALSVPQVRQTPANCWPPELKCRSRMHYYLADLQAKQVDPTSRAVMLDQSGYVLEATTANLLVYNAGEGIVSPPRDQILPGVSLGTVNDLADELSTPMIYRQIELQELETAAEVMLCSTSPCVWPVIRLNGKPIGRRGADSIASRLLAAWSKRVGLDIAKQAKLFANRSSARV